MVSAEVQALFPHSHIRPGQKDLVDDLEKDFADGKIVLVHAPTGLGKTASALSVALRFALQHKKKVFFLTNRHTQHRIAVSTLQEMKHKVSFRCVDLIGKRWMCSHDVAGLYGGEFTEFCKVLVEKGECEFYNNVRDKTSLQVEAKVFVAELARQGPLHNEELTLLSKERRMCSYEISLAMAKDATVIIGDYYYLFNPHIRGTLFNKMDLELEDVIVIVDEGHNLASRVTEMLSSVLTVQMLKNALHEAQKYGYNGLVSWLQALTKVFQEFSVGAEGEILLARAAFIVAVQRIHDYDALIEEFDLAAEEVRKKQRRSYLGGIAAFLAAWPGEDEGFVRILEEKQNGRVLSYNCLDPRLVTREVFQRVYAGVVMSGTLKPTFMYKDILGIDRGVEHEYQPPFPPENKRMIVVPETSTKYDVRSEAMYQRIAAICTDLALLIPGNVAFFFPSYDLRDRVGMFFQSSKKLFWEKNNLSKEEKEFFLAGFKEARVGGGVLLGVTGANFAEGVDLPGDLLNGVVVVGLPLARPELRTKELIRYYDAKFGKGWDYGYIFPAMSKCIQSAGRCIRSEIDKGVIVFLDERFAWDRYYTCFPERVGLMVTKNYGKVIREFFGKG